MFTPGTATTPRSNCWKLVDKAVMAQFPAFVPHEPYMTCSRWWKLICPPERLCLILILGVCPCIAITLISVEESVDDVPIRPVTVTESTFKTESTESTFKMFTPGRATTCEFLLKTIWSNKWYLYRHIEDETKHDGITWAIIHLAKPTTACLIHPLLGFLVACNGRIFWKETKHDDITRAKIHLAKPTRAHLIRLHLAFFHVKSISFFIK